MADKKNPSKPSKGAHKSLASSSGRMKNPATNSDIQKPPADTGKHTPHDPIARSNMWAAWAMFLVSAVTCGVLVLQWWTLQETNRLTRLHFIEAQRARLAVDVKIVGPLELKQNQASLPLEITQTNTGNTPALNARLIAYFAFPYLVGGPNPAERCNRLRQQPVTFFPGVVIPNGDKLTKREAVTFGREEFEKLLKSPNIDLVFAFPYIVGCADYKLSGMPGTHQTPFAYTLFIVGPPHFEDVFSGAIVQQQKMLLIPSGPGRGD